MNKILLAIALMLVGCKPEHTQKGTSGWGTFPAKELKGLTNTATAPTPAVVTPFPIVVFGPANTPEDMRAIYGTILRNGGTIKLAPGIYDGATLWSKVTNQPSYIYIIGTTVEGENVSYVLHSIQIPQAR